MMKKFVCVAFSFFFLNHASHSQNFTTEKNETGGVAVITSSPTTSISHQVIRKPGRHSIKYWMICPGVVVQKIAVDFGGVKPSYLGPPETLDKKFPYKN